MTRKTVMTKDSIRMLLEGFCQGFKVNQACLYADICKQTFYNYCNKHEGFLEHCHNLRRTPSLKAISLIVKSINEGNVNSAKWWLERKCKEEFSLRSEITGEGGEPIKSKVPNITVNFTNEKD